MFTLRHHQHCEIRGPQHQQGEASDSNQHSNHPHNLSLTSLSLKLGCSWNHLGSYTEDSCLGPTSRKSGLISLGCSLGRGIGKAPQEICWVAACQVWELLLSIQSVSRSPAWSWHGHVAKDDLELLIFLSSFSKCWGWGHVPSRLVYIVLRIKPRALGILCKNSTNWTTSPAMLCFKSMRVIFVACLMAQVFESVTRRR